MNPLPERIELTEYLKDAVILISGGTGTFGQACVSNLLTKPIKKIIIFSRDEKKQWDMQRSIPDPRLRFFIGDVRDKDRLERAFHGVDYVIHAAALKQVPAIEYNPIEAIKTNVYGTQNVIDCSIDQGVKKTILLSSDKAVNPINLYGASKLCAEKLMLHGNVYGKCKFAVVRYGNVIGSRGSVLEVFREQVKTGVLTITDKDMSRFWITRENAVDLVLLAFSIMSGGEIFVPNLEKKKVMDLAHAIRSEYSAETNNNVIIKETGIRSGEKLHEVLMTLDESLYASAHDGYYIINKNTRRVRDKAFLYSSS